MGTKHQKFTLNLPGYSDSEKAAIAVEVIDYIIKRTKNKNVDKNGDPFPGYSKSYEKSLDFKNAGKSKGSVDLTLSGDMLNSIEILDVKSRSVVIGFEAGSVENGKADGNIRGTYGSSKPNKKKARDFLGIEPKALESILSKYERDESRADKILATDKAASRIGKDQLEEIDNES